MLHTPRLLLAVAVLGVTVAFVPAATPVAAHDSWDDGWAWVHWPSPDQSLCVGGSGWQNHAEHWIGTHAFWGDCGTLRERRVNALWNRGEWYFGGRFCYQVGWKSNQAAASTLWTTRFLDLGHYGCHNYGQHNWLTMDSWHVAAEDNWTWRPNSEGNPGVRPITWHCHCP